MSSEVRFVATFLLLLVLKAGGVVRADELAVKNEAVKKEEAAVATPAEKAAEQKDSEKKSDQKNDSDQDDNKAKDSKKNDVAKKATEKKDGDKKAADPKAAKKKAAEPLNLKALAAPLNILFGGRGIAVEAVADVVVMEEGGDGNGNNPNDAMFQQMLQQLRPVLASELGFARLMLPELTAEQKKKIKGPADEALKESAKFLAAQQNQQRRGGAMKTNKPTDPRARIRLAIAKAVKETVSEEQLVRFEAELAKRVEKRKQVAIISLVSMMDQQMFLTPEQRTAIIESIAAKWQDDWEKWTKMSQMYGERYFPQVPDNLVVPHLNAEQKAVWKGVQKIEIGWWWGGEQGVDPNADGWWGADEQQNAERGKKAVNGILEIFKQ